MELDYFKIEVDGRVHPVAKHEFGTYEKSLGKKGFSISIWDSNIDAAKQIIMIHEVKHIKISTSNLEFLKEPEFKSIIGIELNGEIKDIQPLENLKELCFLTLLNNRKGKMDFEKLQSLELLHCDYSKQYKNLNLLSNLKNLYLRKYTVSNLQEMTSLTKLEELHLLFSKSETLEGVESLNKLRKITLHECKNLVSLEGIEKLDSLRELLIIDCRNLKDFSVANKLDSQCVALVDGKNIKEVQDSSKDKIQILVNNLRELDANHELIHLIKNQLISLKNCNEINWREKLKNCIINLNEISFRNDGIYTEEREEIISTIEYLLIDFNSDEIEDLIAENRTW